MLIQNDNKDLIDADMLQLAELLKCHVDLMMVLEEKPGDHLS